MTSQKRIAEIVLKLAAQGDDYALWIVEQSDKPRELCKWDLTDNGKAEINNYLGEYLAQEKSRYFSASMLNSFIFNKKFPDHNKKIVINDVFNRKYFDSDEGYNASRFTDVYRIRGVMEYLSFLFGQPISKNRWNTSKAKEAWNRAHRA